MNEKPRSGGESDEALQRELNQLKDEYERLRDEKVRAQRDVETLNRQLEECRNQAEQEYGTSDPEQLQALLVERRRENARLVAEYRTHLEAVRAGLDAVEAEESRAAENGENGAEGAF
ncbi:hypothetical protein SAMN02745704_02440 [Paucidesulfovibrio gracilis DSM 16080]|uniref:Uncharacterized protein n=1 Tax=Paucidesulfovibrio gracilis DSM 16080 TaxID=1121449 RepID=A0A1T4XUE7_9BACT|nr:hypothetical protein [Paucidesulfovibrio gracilis]SKA92671.1 hypothetical protein SAMN02745704_02440 [Paucidesulfovibrio gracilis DSM 16080]